MRHNFYQRIYIYRAQKKDTETNFILLDYLNKSNKYNYIYRNILSKLRENILDI